MLIPGLEGVDWDAVEECDPADNPDRLYCVSQSKCAPPSAPASTPQLEPQPKSEISMTAEIIPFSPPEPEPIFRPVDAPRDFPVHALGPLRGVVEAVARRTQAPIAIAASSALGAASLAVQGHADVETLGGRAPTSLFLLTVAESGERKSACDGLLMRGVERHERDQSQKFGADMEAWRVQSESWRQQANGIKSKIKKGEATAEDLAKLGPEPSSPLLPHRTMSEPTFEGIVKLYEAGNPSLALFSDEGGQFLGGHGMSADNAQKTITALSKLWDGAPIKRTRAGDGSTTLRGRRLAIHLQVQPVIAAKSLTDPLASGQGFLARMLVCQPASHIGSRFIDPDSNREAEDIAIVDFDLRMAQSLAKDPPHMENQPQTLDPVLLLLSAPARAALIQFYNGVESRMARGGELADLKAAASKITEQACRIAGVLTLWESFETKKVTEATMRTAISIAEYYLSEALRITGLAEISAKDVETEKLRKWLLNDWADKAKALGRNPGFIIPRDVVTYGPSSLRETGKVKGALERLAVLGWVARLDPSTPIDGKIPKLAYRVVR